MTEELQNLLDKIQKEGVEAAEAKAQGIEAAAQQHADNLIASAKKEAERLIGEAKQEIARQQESTNATLKQAGRDLLLSLRTHIQEMLGRVVSDQVGQALKPEEMTKLITTLIKNSAEKSEDGVAITLSKADAEKLQSSLLHQLKGVVKAGIEIRPSDDVRSGFRISYDGGKSHFDFSDEELAAYITTYLKPKLRDILGEVPSE